MSTNNIIHPPAFEGKPVVENTQRVRTSSKRRNVVALTKVRRAMMRTKRQQERQAGQIRPERRTEMDRVLPALGLAQRMLTALRVTPSDLSESECEVIEESFLEGIALVMEGRVGPPAA